MKEYLISTTAKGAKRFIKNCVDNNLKFKIVPNSYNQKFIVLPSPKMDCAIMDSQQYVGKFYFQVKEIEKYKRT